MGTYSKYGSTSYQNTTDKVVNTGGTYTLTGVHIGVKKNNELINASKSDFNLISGYATSFDFIDSPDDPRYKSIRINDIAENPDTKERELSFSIRHIKNSLKELTYKVKQAASATASWYWRSEANPISNINITTNDDGTLTYKYNIKYYCETLSTDFSIDNYKLSGTIQSKDINNYFEVKKITLPDNVPGVLGGDYVNISLKSGSVFPTSSTDDIITNDVKLTYTNGSLTSSLSINITVPKHTLVIEEPEVLNKGYIRFKENSGTVTTSTNKITFAIEIGGDSVWSSNSDWEFNKSITICLVRLNSSGTSLGEEVKVLFPTNGGENGNTIKTVLLSYTYSGSTIPAKIKYKAESSNLQGFIWLMDTLSLKSSSSSNTTPTIGGGGAACCFSAGSQILITKTGKTKNIEDIRNNDKVVSYNRYTQKNYISTVDFVVIKDDVTDVAVLTLEDGKSVTMNAYHPILTLDGWKSLTNYHGYATLYEGDYVKTIDGFSKLISIKREESKEFITMYNIGVIDDGETPDIDTDDNFYVNGICAHNIATQTTVYGAPDNFQIVPCELVKDDIIP